MFIVFGFDKEISFCPYCEKAKELLDAKEQKYEFRNLMGDSKEVLRNRETLLTMAGWDSLSGKTVPQIFKSVDRGDTIENGYIGGFTELKAYMDK